jgi:hypothetical protein
MGAFVLPIIAASVVITVICTWIALARYDKKHPPAQDNDPRARRDNPRPR